MTKPTWTPGRFVWRELITGDVAKAKGFYGELFHWSFDDNAMGMDYTIIRLGDLMVGGMMKKPDMAPMFALATYFLVDSIDETLKKVAAAGGSVQMPKMEIPTIGWWALFMDPDSIPVMIFEPLKK